MAADRSIAVNLRLNVTDFKRGVSQSVTELDKLLSKAGNSEQKATTALGEMEQSIRLQGDQWRTMGHTLLGTGTAMAAVGTAVAVTGVNYNKLQQSSRAALTTMLNGATAANSQMDKLDEFAKTSPFSKATFISAQQQMLAFGIETKKVIPYLDALQNAVAAAGGSNNDIAGLAEIMAKIKSSAKITAVDLMQFGNYGVDAATMIGDAMGKTGAQIREDITAGTLDADSALDALAQGMSTKFDGAAAGVKNTFDGAMDRVKAAFRDLSSSIMEPFVGKEGGGIFTSLLNGTADVLRDVEALPAPIRTAGSALFGISTMAALAGGAFFTFTPKIVENYRAMTTLRAESTLLNSAMTKTGKLMSGLGKAAGIAGGVIAVSSVFDTLSNSMQNAPASINETTKALLASKDALASMDDLFAGQSNFWVGEIDGLSGAINRLVNPSGYDQFWDKTMSILTFGRQAGDGDRNAIVSQFNQIGESLAEMVNSGNAEKAAEIYQNLSTQWMASGGTLEELNREMPAYQDALDGAANNQELLGESVTDTNTALEEAIALVSAQTAAMQALTDATNQQRDANGSLVDSQLDYMDAYASMNDVISEGYYLIEDASTGQLDLANSSREAVDGMRDLATNANAEIQAMVEANASQGEIDARIQELIADFDAMAIAAGWPAEKVAVLREQLGLLESADSVVVDISADTDMADAEIQNLLNELIEANGSITVDATTDPAAQALARQLGLVEVSEGIFRIDANTDPSAAQLMAQLGSVNTSTGVMTIDANSTQAANKNHGIKLEVDNTTGYVKISAVESGAYSAAESVKQYINGQWAYIKIGGVKVATGLGGTGGLTQADGGVVTYFANGSENHVAQIASAGSWRVWAEDETGGEAYIPLAPQKRKRSLAITENVANRFGYDLVRRFANGDVYGPGYSPGVQTVSPVVTVQPVIEVQATVMNPWTGKQVAAEVRNIVIRTAKGQG